MHVNTVHCVTTLWYCTCIRPVHFVNPAVNWAQTWGRAELKWPPLHKLETEKQQDLWVPQQTHRALRDNIRPQRVVVRGIQFLNRKELTQARLRIWSVCEWGRGEEYCNSYTLLHMALLWNYIRLAYSTRQLLKRQTLHTHKHTNNIALTTLTRVLSPAHGSSFFHGVKFSEHTVSLGSAA